MVLRKGYKRTSEVEQMTSTSSTPTLPIEAIKASPPEPPRRISIRKLAAISIMVLALLLVGKMLHIKYVIATGLKGEFGPATAQWQAEVTQQVRRSEQIHGAAVFLGDSLTVGLATSNVTAKAENFGIDGDSLDWLLLRMPRYRFSGAKVIVVEIGINNWLQRGHLGFSGLAGKYHQLLAMLPGQVPVVAIGILPVNSHAKSLPDSGQANAAIRDANKQIEAECWQFRNCHYLDLVRTLADKSGNLQAGYDAGDGVHLTTAGYEAWAITLTPLLEKLMVTPL
jgi:lysophospholipase L1-like esterase